MNNKHEIIVADYQGFAVSFTDDGWFNATAAAFHFGRRVDHYLANAETKAYIAALSEDPNTRNLGYFMKTRRGQGGGTWLHPDLAVHFARWLDIKFDADVDYHHVTPEKLVADIALLMDGPAGDLRDGVAHALALFTITCLEGSVPDPTRWSALKELQDPDWWKETPCEPC